MISSHLEDDYFVIGCKDGTLIELDIERLEVTRQIKREHSILSISGIESLPGLFAIQ
jgi:hypothetical protein